jgi:hypothetical protein
LTAEAVAGTKAYARAAKAELDAGEVSRLGVGRKGFEGYSNLKMSETVDEIMQIGMTRPNLAKGLALVSKFRVRGAWFGGRLARWGLIDPKYNNECPFCGEGVPETLEHFLLNCTTFQGERDCFLTHAIKRLRKRAVLNGGQQALSDKTVAELLTGGEDVLVGKSNCFKRVVRITDKDGVLAGEESGLAALALFLQEVWNSRTKVIEPLWKSRNDLHKANALRGVRLDPSRAVP